MKKHGIILLLGMALCIAPPAGSFASEEAGRVLAVKKNVYVIRNESKDDAVPKMPLLMKDAVETDEKSRTKLFFTDDSILSLGEKSRVEVEEYLYNSEENKSKSVYRLMDGYLKVVVGRSDLEIHTPTAVAAARGTKFIVVTGGHGENAFTDVIVLSGMVDTWSSIKGAAAGKITVGPGSSNRIYMNKAPGGTQTTKAEVMNQFAESTSVAGSTKTDSGPLPTLVAPEPVILPPPLPPPTNIAEIVEQEPEESIEEPPASSPEPPSSEPPPPPPPPPTPPPLEAFTPVTININFPD